MHDRGIAVLEKYEINASCCKQMESLVLYLAIPEAGLVLNQRVILFNNKIEYQDRTT